MRQLFCLTKHLTTATRLASLFVNITVHHVFLEDNRSDTSRDGYGLFLLLLLNKILLMSLIVFVEAEDLRVVLSILLILFH